MTELISARTRNQMREISSNVNKDPLKAAWAGAGFAPVPVAPGRGGGQRKYVFDSYVDGVDWTDPGQVKRALTAFEDMLNDTRTRYPDDWEPTLAQLTDVFGRDGYQVTATGQILPIGQWRPEHVRDDGEAYTESLRLLRGARNQMERLHLLTDSMPEERLRDVLLVALNAYFEGRSTGETFNGKGKSDILIRVADRTVTVGECKFYDGPKSVTDALDQLLGYTDQGARRVSLLIFYRDEKNPDARIAGTVAAIEAHPGWEFTDPTRATDLRQWSFTVRGSGASGTAPLVEVALIPFVIA
ncbi:hypothetical protein [Streptomyces hydrogenans]|uniref:hypothetical protein n=1 Tax=Streptomyces hydrogenans TaxID=1873719 RepID=UPI00381E5534